MPRTDQILQGGVEHRQAPSDLLAAAQGLPDVDAKRFLERFLNAVEVLETVPPRRDTFDRELARCHP
jgi:hypothetical protein